jgi:clan AA aspartic protease
MFISVQRLIASLGRVGAKITDGMGLTHVSVGLKVPGAYNGGYDALLLVDTGATDSRAPGSELAKADIQPVGRTSYELADGSVHEYPFGLAQIEFMGEVTAGRVIFGPEEVAPILGVTALESVGITIDPATRTRKRLPAIPLK